MKGAAWRFDGANDGPGNLVDDNTNSLEIGGNVYETAGQDLQVNVSPLAFWRPTSGDPVLQAFAGATGQAVQASATNYVFLDAAGALVINQSGFPLASVQHLRLATVVTSATEITNIPDQRPVMAMPTAGVGLATAGMPRLAAITGIDAKSATTTVLYTVPGGNTAVITNAVVRCEAATAITTPPKAGIGVALDEDDIAPSQPLVGLLTAGKIFIFPLVGGAVQVSAGQVIKLGIDVAAVGTSQTIAVDLMGYLVV